MGSQKRRSSPVPPSKQVEVANNVLTLTEGKIKELLPKGTTKQVTEEVMQLVNTLESTTGVSQELLEEDIESYIHLASAGSYSLVQYINAVKFCSLKRHMNVTQAWGKVFPDRRDRLDEGGKSENKGSHASAFNTSKLVVAIDKEMMIPDYLRYSHLRHAAIKKQFELMSGKSSQGEGKVTPMVEHLAAKELALLTAQPTETVIDLKIAPSDAAVSMQQEMNDHVKDLVKLTRKKLLAGENITDVQAIGLDFTNVGREDD